MRSALPPARGPRRRAFIYLTLLVTGLVLVVTPAFPARGAAADSPDGRTAGDVYVNDNTASPQNTVAGFARSAQGTLSALPGSPFDAGGTGLGASLGSQGALALTQDGDLLIVADAGSNQISVLRVQNDGSLHPVAGSPFSSNGVQPVSIAVEGSTVFVANTGNAGTLAGDCNITSGGGSNYTGFQLDRSGRLTPLAGSTFCVPPASGLGDVILSPDGRHLAGVRVNPSLIDSFDVDHLGEITVSPGSPFPAQAAGPFGSSFRPTNAAQLFVSNAHAGANAGTVSAFNVAKNATLTSIGASPYPDQQTAPCWLTISNDGRFLFAANTASQTISSYSIAGDGTLTLLGSTSSHVAGTITDVGLDGSGRALFNLQTSNNSVSAFTMHAGSLTEVTSSPFALPVTASHPAGIAVR